MVNEKDSDQPAPDESRPGPAGRPNKQPSERRRDQQAHRYPQRKQSTRGAEQFTLSEVSDVPLEVRWR